MKKKNGFIAISIIYSFFLCFVMLMMGMLANYSHSKMILNKTNAPLTFNQDSRLSTKIIENNPLKDDFVKDFTKGFPNSSTTPDDITKGSGLYSVDDNDGKSYYFRGAVENNYVNFAGKIWRVVRINGDGTIRLILDDKLPTNYAFNTSYNERKYAGYTFDNTPCTNSSPCESSYNVISNSFSNTHNGTNSTIKGELESWYKTNLKDYDDKIAYGTFCNDTSYGSGDEAGTLNYGARERLVGTNKGNPTLICPDPKDKNNTMRTYGGVYKLKIGLLSADEMNYAGLSWYEPHASDKNYLHKNNVWWGLSPYEFNSNSIAGAYVLAGRPGELVSHYVDDAYEVRPVINLNQNIQVSGGNGMKDTPYVISN